MKKKDALFVTVTAFSWTYIIGNSAIKILGDSIVVEIAAVLSGISWGMFVGWGVLAMVKFLKA